MTQLNLKCHDLARCLRIGHLVVAQLIFVSWCHDIRQDHCLDQPQTVVQVSSGLLATAGLVLRCSSRLTRKLVRRPYCPAVVLGPASEELVVRPEV